MKPNEIYASAWRFIAKTMSRLDMSEHTINDEVIEAIDNLVDTFEDQARQLEAEQAMIEGVHGNLKQPKPHEL